MMVLKGFDHGFDGFDDGFDGCASLFPSTNTVSYLE